MMAGKEESGTTYVTILSTPYFHDVQPITRAKSTPEPSTELLFVKVC